MKKDMRWLQSSLIAHRGFFTKNQKIPENSLIAFRKAIENNYAIELDINLLRDGNIIVFHDDDFARTCDLDDRVSECTYEDIKTLTLFSSNEPIPTLKDTLALIAGQVPILIELKSVVDYQLFCERFKSIIKHYHHPYAVFSFDPRIVAWFKKNMPEAIRGQITSFFIESESSRFRKWFLKSMFFNFISKPDFISYDISNLPNKYANRVLRKNKTVISYTARSQEQLDFVKQYYHNAVFEGFIPKL